MIELRSGYLEANFYEELGTRNLLPSYLKRRQ